MRGRDPAEDFVSGFNSAIDDIPHTLGGFLAISLVIGLALTSNSVLASNPSFTLCLCVNRGSSRNKRKRKSKEGKATGKTQRTCPVQWEVA